MLAYALGRTLILSDEPTDRRNARQAGGERLSLRQPGGKHRHQPAVSARKRGQDDLAQHGRMTCAIQQPASTAARRRYALSRRTFLRGVGVTMALPWLESLPRLGRDAGVAAGRRHPTAGEFPKRFAVLFMGNGINGNHWWAKGAGAEMELGKSLEPLAPLKTKMNFINGLFNKPATGVGIHPGPDGQHSLRRAAAKGGGAPRRHQHGPGAGQPHRPGHDAAEPGAGLRAADHRLPRDEFLDGLQLAHFLAERRLARADGGLSVAGVRQPVRKPRQPAQQERARPREGAGQRR